MSPLTQFWDWVDSRAVVRRIVLFITLWMTWRAFVWATEFTYAHPTVAGSEVALIIAAVTAPITVLQGYIFKVYSDGRDTGAQ